MLNGMLANVFACKEIVVPMVNQKVEEGVLTGDTILSFAEENIGRILDGL